MRPPLLASGSRAEAGSSRPPPRTDGAGACGSFSPLPAWPPAAGRFPRSTLRHHARLPPRRPSPRSPSPPPPAARQLSPGVSTTTSPQPETSTPPARPAAARQSSPAVSTTTSPKVVTSTSPRRRPEDRPADRVPAGDAVWDEPAFPPRKLGWSSFRPGSWTSRPPMPRRSRWSAAWPAMNGPCGHHRMG